MPFLGEGKQRENRPYRWRQTTALCFAATLGLTIVLALGRDPRETHALRTPGAIIAVTQGDRPLVLGAAWQKLVLPLAPHLQDRLGGTFITPYYAEATDTERVIWRRRPPGFDDIGDTGVRSIREPLIGHVSGPAFSKPMRLIGRVAGVIVEEDGQRSRKEARLKFWKANDGTPIDEYQLTWTPREGARVRVRFEDGGVGGGRWEEL